MNNCLYADYFFLYLQDHLESEIPMVFVYLFLLNFGILTMHYALICGRGICMYLFSKKA